MIGNVINSLTWELEAVLIVLPDGGVNGVLL